MLEVMKPTIRSFVNAAISTELAIGSVVGLQLAALTHQSKPRPLCGPFK